MNEDEPVGAGEDDFETMRKASDKRNRLPELDVKKTLDDSRSNDFIKETEWLMKACIYVDAMQVKVKTRPKGKSEEDVEMRGGSVMTLQQLFDRMFTSSLRDGPLHDIMRKNGR